MPNTTYGKFYDFCKDTGSLHSTLPVCNLFNESLARGGNGYGGCDLIGIKLSHGRNLANLGTFLLGNINHWPVNGKTDRGAYRLDTRSIYCHIGGIGFDVEI